MSGNIFFFLSQLGMEGATGFQWVEDRDAAEHPTMHKIAPLDKDVSGPSVDNAAVENLDNLTTKNISNNKNI